MALIWIIYIHSAWIEWAEKSVTHCWYYNIFVTIYNIFVWVRCGSVQLNKLGFINNFSCSHVRFDKMCRFSYRYSWIISCFGLQCGKKRKKEYYGGVDIMETNMCMEVYICWRNSLRFRNDIFLNCFGKFRMESGKTSKRKVTYQLKFINFKFSIVFANNQILIKNHMSIFANLICVNVKRIENMLSFLNFDL